MAPCCENDCNPSVTGLPGSGLLFFRIASAIQWGAIVLGIIGAQLFPCKRSFFFTTVFSAPSGRGLSTRLLSWTLLVCVGSLVVRYRQGRKMSVWRLAICIVFASLFSTLVLGMTASLGLAVFVLCVVLPATAASIVAIADPMSGNPSKTIHLGSWIRALFRAQFVFLFAPILLAASCSTTVDDACGHEKSWCDSLVKVLLRVFPHVLLIGFVLPFTQSQLRRYDCFGNYGFTEHIGHVWLAFSTWAWISSGILLTLSPDSNRLDTNSLKNKAGPFATVCFLSIGIAALAPYAFPVFWAIVTGKILQMQFSRSLVGAVLDQPTILKHYFLYVLFFAETALFLVVSRWMSDRTDRLGYWSFAIPTLIICLLLLSLLTYPFYALLLYIDAMGATTRRDIGVIMGLIGYFATIAFFLWVVWPAGRR